MGQTNDEKTYMVELTDEEIMCVLSIIGTPLGNLRFEIREDRSTKNMFPESTLRNLKTVRAIDSFCEKLRDKLRKDNLLSLKGGE
jgi:hypothetical protein